MRASASDVLVITAMCAIWAGNYFVIDALLPYVDPFTLSFLRAALGGLFVLAIGGYRLGELRRPDLFWLVLFAAFNTALFLVLLNVSLQTASEGVDSTLVYTQPIMVVALSPLLGERLTFRRLVGMSAAFAGVAVVFLPSLLGATLVIGDMYAIAAAASWAVAVVLFKRWNSTADARAITATQSLVGAVLIMPVFLFEKPYVDPTPTFWVLLAYSVVLASGLTYTVFLRMLAKMSASQFTSYLFLVPVLATVMVSVLNLSAPRPNEVIGTALVATGIVIVNR